MNKKIIYIIGGVFLLLAALIIWKGVPSNKTAPSSDKLSSIPVEDRAYYEALIDGIRSGGPPKDGIPAVDNPKYESAQSADTWLEPNDIIFGVINNDKPFAYPQRILVWHEIVNETINGIPSSITYCPLTGTTIGFKNPSPSSNNPTLGVSGKLVNSNLIMYDRETDSYWPQILAKSILGPETGNSLEEFPVTWTTWEKWKKKNPDTMVMTKDTGFFRNYNAGGDPYGSYLKKNGYYFSDRTLFEPINSDDRLGNKVIVVGMRDNDRNAVAILKDTLRKKKEIKTQLGNKDIVIIYDPELDFYEAKYVSTGEVINAFDSMWFAWFTYYPDTKLIQ